MKKISILLSALVIISLSIMIPACKKNDDSANGGKASYTVRMTDAPGPYSAVYIDVRGVEITGNGGKAVMLNVNPGIYNLLNFTNGLDTIIAFGSIDAGTVEQIRLVLGPDNSIVLDNVTYPLKVPSGEQSGLKLNVHQTIEAGSAYAILLDFDANRSIILQGNGEYKLKPVIRTVNLAIAGSIKGHILPVGVLANVTAVNGTDTFSSSVNLFGNFMIMGLPPATYNLTITPQSPYKQEVKTGVLVTAGVSTDVGLTTLTQ